MPLPLVLEDSEEIAIYNAFSLSLHLVPYTGGVLKEIDFLVFKEMCCHYELVVAESYEIAREMLQKLH